MEDIWFGLEVKVRNLIKELIEPTLRRTAENRNMIDRIEKSQDTLGSRIDDIDLNLGKFSRKASSIDDILKKTIEFDSAIRLMETRFTREREEIKAEVNSFNSKLVNFEEWLGVFEHAKEALRSDIANITYSMQILKNQNEDRFLSFREEYRNKLQDLDSMIVKFDVTLLQYDKNIKNLGKEVGDSNTLIQTTAHACSEVSKKNKDIVKSIKTLKKSVIDSVEKLRLLSIKQMTDFQAGDRQILEMINTEVPIRCRLLISDTLNAIINDPYQKYLLALLEKDKLSSILELSITPETKKSILEKMVSIDNILRSPVPERKLSINESVRGKRSRQRTVFVVKKDSGSEFQSPVLSKSNSRKSIRRDIKLKPSLDKIEEYIPPEDSNFLKQKFTEDNRRRREMIDLKNYEIIKDELQIARYNSLIRGQTIEIEECDADDNSFNSSVSYGPPIDYHPLIEEAKLEVSLMVKNLETLHINDTNSIISELSDIKAEMEHKYKLTMINIDKTTSDSQRSLKELELIINQAIAETNSAMTMRKRDQSDFGVEIKALNLKAENIESQYGAINSRMDSINKTMDFIVETLKIINILCKQDEVDRESIALMGYKESKTKTAKPVVSIDKQCFSCTGQGSVVISAFKIACLAYAPSPVVYKNATLSRKELIEIQSKLLASVKVDKEIQVATMIDDVRGRGRTASYNKINRPLSVPSSNFTLQIPRADYSLDSEFLPHLRKHGNFLSSSIQS
jgi:hypothetical protein